MLLFLCLMLPSYQKEILPDLFLQISEKRTLCLLWQRSQAVPVIPEKDCICFTSPHSILILTFLVPTLEKLSDFLWKESLLLLICFNTNKSFNFYAFLYRIFLAFTGKVHNKKVYQGISQ